MVDSNTAFRSTFANAKKKCGKLQYLSGLTCRLTDGQVEFKPSCSPLLSEAGRGLIKGKSNVVFCILLLMVDGARPLDGIGRLMDGL